MLKSRRHRVAIGSNDRALRTRFHPRMRGALAQEIRILRAE
jgi:hypothetical protein